VCDYVIESVHLYTHTHTHTHAHSLCRSLSHTHVCIHVHICTYVHTCVYKCMHTREQHAHLYARRFSQTLFSHRLAYCATVGNTAPSTAAAELPDVLSPLACKEEVRFEHNMSILKYYETLG